MLPFLFLSFFCLTATAQQYCGVGQTLFESKCLQFFHINLGFNAAETVCAASEGHLVSIPNSIVNRYVATQAQQYTNGDFWIGAKTVSGNVTDPLNWYWTDGSDFSYQNYQAGQPVNQGYNTCLQMRADTGLWSTQSCDSSTVPYFACEYPAQLPPTCPTPVVPSHCPSGYAWFDKTDFCYRNYVRNLNFADARSLCQADGGDLASIHSQTENDFLVQFTKHGINDTSPEWERDTWIGFVYLNSNWQWTDGSIVDFINWGVGEPNVMKTDWWTVLVPDPHTGWEKTTQWNNVGNYEERSTLCKLPARH